MGSLVGPVGLISLAQGGVRPSVIGVCVANGTGNPRAKILLNGFLASLVLEEEIICHQAHVERVRMAIKETSKNYLQFSDTDEGEVSQRQRAASRYIVM
jgi:hypothetical protein